MAQGLIKFPQKPISLDNCDSRWVLEYLSLTLTSDVTEKPLEAPFALFRLSYMYYTALGAITAILTGIIISWLTGCNKGKVTHRDLLSPVIHRFLSQDKCDSDVVSKDDVIVLNSNNDVQLKCIKNYQFFLFCIRFQLHTVSAISSFKLYLYSF